MFIRGKKDSFGKFLDSCIDSRLDNLDDQNRLSAKYSTFYKRGGAILEEIKNNLPEELYCLLEEYSDLQDDYLCYYQEYFYRHGVKDCCMLMNCLYK